tara:strand:+ start:727 stop:1155 length:429 start_codon:yes stop_codon:yes gene_type:complete
MENYTTTTISFDTKYDLLYEKIQLLIDTLQDDIEQDKLKEICIEITEIKKLMKCKYKINQNEMRQIKSSFYFILEKLILFISEKDKPIQLLHKLIKEVKEKEDLENDNQINNLRKLNTMLIKENTLLKREKLFRKIDNLEII